MSVSQSLYLSIYLNVPSLALLCFPLFVIVPSFHCSCVYYLSSLLTLPLVTFLLSHFTLLFLSVSHFLSLFSHLSFSFLSLSLSLFLHLHFSLFLLFLSTPRFSLSLPPHSLHSTPSLCSLSLPPFATHPPPGAVGLDGRRRPHTDLQEQKASSSGRRAECGCDVAAHCYIRGSRCRGGAAPHSARRGTPGRGCTRTNTGRATLHGPHCSHIKPCGGTHCVHAMEDDLVNCCWNFQHAVNTDAYSERGKCPGVHTACQHSQELDLGLLARLALMLAYNATGRRFISTRDSILEPSTKLTTHFTHQATQFFFSLHLAHWYIHRSGINNTSTPTNTNISKGTRTKCECTGALGQAGTRSCTHRQRSRRPSTFTARGLKPH